MAEITWIKLKTDMFDSTKIRLIEKLPEGDTILVIWIKLLTAAGKANSNGYIMLSENIPMNVEEMAVIFDRPLNTVRLALEAFKRYGMVEVDENEIIRISNWEKHQNIDGMARIREQNRIRKQRERERKKAIEAPKQEENEPCHVTVTPSHATEREKERDKDIEKEREEEKEEAVPPSPHPSSQIDVSFLKIKTYFEQHIRPTTYRDAQDINKLLEYYKDADLIIEAFKIALDRGKPFINYIDGILKRWSAEQGINSYQDFLAKGGNYDAASGAQNRPNTPTFAGADEEFMRGLSKFSTK